MGAKISCTLHTVCPPYIICTSSFNKNYELVLRLFSPVRFDLLDKLNFRIYTRKREPTYPIGNVNRDTPNVKKSKSEQSKRNKGTVDIKVYQHLLL